MLGCLVAARAQWADMQGKADLAADFAQQALGYLPGSNPFSCSIRSVTTIILGDISWMKGNLEQARYAYEEAVHLSRSADNVYLTIITTSNLADVLMELGKIHLAGRLYSEILEVPMRPDGSRLPWLGRVYAGLGKVFYEWNNLETAMQYAGQCIELSQQWKDFGLLAKGYAILARLEYALDNPDKAKEAILAIDRLAGEQLLSPQQSIGVKASLAPFWLAEGNLERVCQLVREANISSSDEIPYLRELEYLALLRLLMAQGDYDTAQTLSQRLLQRAVTITQMGRVIEMLVLQALILQAKKEVDLALALLEKALSLAQPEGYVRTFLNEGEPMAKLLYLAKARGIGSDYTLSLLSEMSTPVTTISSGAPLLIEPLSQRELEVLAFIEAGCSNQEIADKLVISIATVKRHISNIFAKLGVQNRTQAVFIGRELRLFS
jgi:LuxR family maltose regulon positive regulatory protein